MKSRTGKSPEPFDGGARGKDATGSVATASSYIVAQRRIPAEQTQFRELIDELPSDFRPVVELMVSPPEWRELIDRLKKGVALHTDEGLQDEKRAYQWLMQDAVRDTSFTDSVRARSWIYAAGIVTAVEVEQARRKRYGLVNREPDYGFSRDYLDRLKEATDLEREIGLYVDLRRAGKHFKGLCPFHPDRNPSLVVWPEISAWRCFGCGAKGDVFTWLQNIQDWEFRQAVNYLSASTGIEQDRYLAVGELLDS